MWVSGNRLPNFISLQERTTHQLETLYSFSCAHKTQSPSPSSRFDLISWRPCLSLCCWACPRLPRALSGSCQWDLGLFHQYPPGLAGGDSRNKGTFISQDTHRVSLCLLMTLKSVSCGSHLQLEFLIPDDSFLAIYFRPVFMCSVKRRSVASAVGAQITLCLGKWPLVLAKEPFGFPEPSGALFSSVLSLREPSRQVTYWKVLIIFLAWFFLRALMVKSCR